MPKDVEQCIRDNAPKVEQAINPLNTAVDFLVGDVCAEPIAAELERRQLAYFANMQQQAKKQCEARPKPTPPAGAKAEDNEETDPCTPGALDYTALVSNGGWTMFGAGASRAEPPQATALAAKLLLDLRLARTKSTQDSH